MSFDTSNMAQRMMSRFFRPVNEVVWDLMSGRVGIKTKDGIVTLEGEGDDATVALNMFDDFGMPLPAFAQNTAIGEIKNGDLIYNDKRAMGWVIKTPTEGTPAKAATKTKPAVEKVTARRSFRLLKPDGTMGDWMPPKVTTLGLDMNGAMVLRSLLNTLPEGGLGSMQGMLMPMMMMNGGELGDIGDMLPMMLMMQTGMGGMGADGGTNAGMGNMMGMMMQMKMMEKMMGGKGGKPNAGGGFFN